MWRANPNVRFQFTPIVASWINQIESWFGIITRQSIRRGTFSPVKTLIEQIRDYIAHWNPTWLKLVRTTGPADVRERVA